MKLLTQTKYTMARKLPETVVKLLPLMLTASHNDGHCNSSLIIHNFPSKKVRASTVNGLCSLTAPTYVA